MVVLLCARQIPVNQGRRDGAISMISWGFDHHPLLCTTSDFPRPILTGLNVLCRRRLGRVPA